MTKINKFLDLGDHYININEIVYFSVYNQTMAEEMDLDFEIPEEYQFAIEVEFVNGKSTVFYLTSGEWQCAYAQIQKMRVGAYSEITEI